MFPLLIHTAPARREAWRGHCLHHQHHLRHQVIKPSSHRRFDSKQQIGRRRRRRQRWATDDNNALRHLTVGDAHTGNKARGTLPTGLRRGDIIRRTSGAASPLPRTRDDSSSSLGKGRARRPLLSPESNRDNRGRTSPRLGRREGSSRVSTTTRPPANRGFDLSAAMSEADRLRKSRQSAGTGRTPRAGRLEPLVRTAPPADRSQSIRPTGGSDGIATNVVVPQEREQYDEQRRRDLRATSAT